MWPCVWVYFVMSCLSKLPLTALRELLIMLAHSTLCTLKSWLRHMIVCLQGWIISLNDFMKHSFPVLAWKINNSVNLTQPGKINVLFDRRILPHTSFTDIQSCGLFSPSLVFFNSPIRQAPFEPFWVECATSALPWWLLRECKSLKLITYFVWPDHCNPELFSYSPLLYHLKSSSPSELCQSFFFLCLFPTATASLTENQEQITMQTMHWYGHSVVIS